MGHSLPLLPNRPGESDTAVLQWPWALGSHRMALLSSRQVKQLSEPAWRDSKRHLVCTGLPRSWQVMRDQPSPSLGLHGVTAGALSVCPVGCGLGGGL